MATRTRRGKLPAVQVECPECWHRWESRAQRHARIRCPRCGHSVRVKREISGQLPAVATDTAATVIPQTRITRPVAEQLQTAALARPLPPAQVMAAAASWREDDDEDDGGTWLYDDHGVLVEGAWTWDGQLVPAAPRIGRAALMARDWRIEPNPVGAANCWINRPPAVGAPAGTPRQHCIGRARYEVLGGWICDSCLDALGQPMKAPVRTNPDRAAWVPVPEPIPRAEVQDRAEPPVQPPAAEEAELPAYFVPSPVALLKAMLPGRRSGTQQTG